MLLGKLLGIADGDVVNVSLNSARASFYFSCHSDTESKLSHDCPRCLVEQLYDSIHADVVYAIPIGGIPS